MKDIYQKNAQKYREKALVLEKNLKKLAIFRIVTFAISVIIIVFLANERLLVPLLVAAPVSTLAFILLIKRYNQLDYQKQHSVFLKEINEQEVLKLDTNLSGFPSGQKFTGPAHPYVSDLDIFGPHSLFQLINRATTESGHVMLAEWLSSPAADEVVFERQQAIKELAPKLEWRQGFQASGMHFESPKSDYQKLLAWIEKPVQLLPEKLKYLLICIPLSLLSTVAAVVLIINIFADNAMLYLLPLALILYINSLVLKKVRPITEGIVKETVQSMNVLGGYRSLIIKIEPEGFHSKILQQLQSVFSKDSFSAEKEINKLIRLLDVFHNTRNPIYPIFNTLWLLDFHWIILAEEWKLRNSPYLRPWALALSEFEVLGSLAGFSYSNPSFTFPEIKDAPYTIHFEKLGHPLIATEARVCNDFHLEGQGGIAMVTGSNMAGKSTFLRTVGINLVLALMGAPCCAKSGQVSNIKVFSSMRTHDNLEEGVSSFYAELKRVQQLLGLIESGKPIFFLLDEMFKGTNSKDRHKGGFSLIKQLKGLNVFGIISTHDLDMATLAGKYGIVTNYSFNSDIREGEMFFDYTLTNGLCRDFNASELMKRSGINIISDMEEIG